jgi:iduronate 2-sulfatase
MGYSIRTADVRYTEWRDWQSKAVVARELYLTETDPAELKNHADDPSQKERLATAERLLLEKFPRGH